MLIPPREAWNPFAAMLRFWAEWTTRTFEAFDPREDEDIGPDGPEAPVALERADLLSLRMQVLHLHPDELGSADIWGFRELQRLCVRCDHRRKCARDLADEFADPGWQDWRNYCPNGTTLSILSALRGAGTTPSAQP